MTVLFCRAFLVDMRSSALHKSCLTLQAYISSFSLYPEVPESGADRNSELTLILMASSADPAVFKELLRGKKYIAQVIQLTSIALRQASSLTFFFDVCLVCRR